MIAHVLNGVINKPARDALLIDHALRELSSKETAISPSGVGKEPRYEFLISRLVRLHWDWAHMLRVKESYYARYQRSMEEDIKNATEGDFSAFCLSLVGSIPTTCTNCYSQRTPIWRRNPEGHPLCNACGLFLKLHGVVRPLSSKADVIKKRNRGIGNTVPVGGIKETGDQLAAKNADNGTSIIAAEQQPILAEPSRLLGQGSSTNDAEDSDLDGEYEEEDIGID